MDTAARRRLVHLLLSKSIAEALLVGTVTVVGTQRGRGEGEKREGGVRHGRMVRRMGPALNPPPRGVREGRSGITR